MADEKHIKKVIKKYENYIHKAKENLERMTLTPDDVVDQADVHEIKGDIASYKKEYP